MSKVQEFGAQGTRSSGGALLCSELEKIASFMRFGGFLASELFGVPTVVSLKGLTVEDSPSLQQSFPGTVLVGANVEALDSTLELSTRELRALEALTPGPLLLNYASAHDSQTFVGIPDHFDMLTIASYVGGVVTAKLGRLALDPDADHSAAEVMTNVGVKPLAVLSGATAKLGASAENTTIVRFSDSNGFSVEREGLVSTADINSAISRRAQREFRDWT